MNLRAAVKKEAMKKVTDTKGLLEAVKSVLTKAGFTFDKEGGISAEIYSKRVAVYVHPWKTNNQKMMDKAGTAVSQAGLEVKPRDAAHFHVLLPHEEPAPVKAKKEAAKDTTAKAAAKAALAKPVFVEAAAAAAKLDETRKVKPEPLGIEKVVERESATDKVKWYAFNGLKLDERKFMAKMRSLGYDGTEDLTDAYKFGRAFADEIKAECKFLGYYPTGVMPDAKAAKAIDKPESSVKVECAPAPAPAPVADSGAAKHKTGKRSAADKKADAKPAKK